MLPGDGLSRSFGLLCLLDSDNERSCFRFIRGPAETGERAQRRWGSSCSDALFVAKPHGSGRATTGGSKQNFSCHLSPGPSLAAWKTSYGTAVVLHGEDRMIGKVKITRLHHAEVARVAALIDGKDDAGIARFSLP
jgi:hypothetical protein